MKRTLSILLCVLVAVSFMPAAAFAGITSASLYPCNGEEMFNKVSPQYSDYVENETTWAGNTFIGWFDSEVGGEKINEAGFEPTGTYYAHWQNESGNTVLTQPLTIAEDSGIYLYCGDDASTHISNTDLEEYGISFDESNDITLTLDNASIMLHSGTYAAIGSDLDKTINVVLKGQNQIGNPVDYVEGTTTSAAYLTGYGFYCLGAEITFSSTDENNGINISTQKQAVFAKKVNTISGFKGSITIENGGGGNEITIVAMSEMNILGGTLEVHARGEIAIGSIGEANIKNCTLKVYSENTTEYSAAIYSPGGLNIDKSDVYISYKGASGIKTYATPYKDINIRNSEFVMETDFDNIGSYGFYSKNVNFISCPKVYLNGYNNCYIYGESHWNNCSDIKIVSSQGYEESDYGWFFKNSTGVFSCTSDAAYGYFFGDYPYFEDCDVYVSENWDGTGKIKVDPEVTDIEEVYPYVELKAKQQSVPSGGGGGGTPKYEIVIAPAENGSVSIENAKVYAGDSVTVNVKAYDGYVLKDIKAYTKNRTEVELTAKGNDEYTFKMPVSDVRIEAQFAPTECPEDSTCPLYEFKDLKKNKWYHDGIHFCLENDIMQGTGWGRFEPNGTLTRAQTVTALWRIAGSPAATEEVSFSDVKSGKWYTDAVKWAAGEGIVNGYSAEKFGTNEAITREEMAQLLYNYAKTVDKGFKGSWVFLLSNPDAAEVHSWADEAMHWCVMKGIITGDAEGMLAPRANATRAEAAQMYMSFISALEE